MRSFGLVVITIAITGLQGCDLRQNDEQLAPRSDLIGVWLITQTKTTTPSGIVVDDNPQPGLYIFTKGHFSNVLIPNGQRALFGERPADQERLAAYDNFIVDAGTYVVTGSTLTTRNLIAKVPNVMTGNEGVSYRYEVNGDTLVMTFSGGWAPRDGEIAYRLRRLE